jgi:hypothetical protein
MGRPVGGTSPIGPLSTPLCVPVNVPSLDGDIADDVKAVHVDMRVGEGSEPAAVEFDAGCLSLAAQSTWRLKDDVICEHFRKPVDIAGVLRKHVDTSRAIHSPWPNPTASKERPATLRWLARPSSRLSNPTGSPRPMMFMHSRPRKAFVADAIVAQPVPRNAQEYE